MSDSGIGGALLLSTQLSVDRYFDKLARRRFENGIGAENDVLRQHVTALVNDYNKLVQMYNQLREQAIKSANEGQNLVSRLDAAEREIARLRAENTELSADAEHRLDRVIALRDALAKFDPDSELLV